MNDRLLILENLSVSYRGEESEVLAVDRVSLTLGRFGCTALIGESGSGKTTVAAAILGLLAGNARVLEGAIRYGGEDVLSFSPERFRRFRWETVSLVGQGAQAALNPTLNLSF